MRAEPLRLIWITGAPAPRARRPRGRTRRKAKPLTGRWVRIALLALLLTGIAVFALEKAAVFQGPRSVRSALVWAGAMSRPDPAARQPHGSLGVALAWLVTIAAMGVLLYLLWV